MPNNQASVINIQFEEKYVAYLDVLGFKNLLKSGNHKKLQEYFNKVLQTLQELHGLKRELQSLLISDAIILTTPHDRFGLRQLIIAVRKIQSILLWKKILIRGAISFGDVFYDQENNVIVGEGVVKAYLLESNQAVFPRVILDPAVLKDEFSDRAGFIEHFNSPDHFDGEGAFIYQASERSKIIDDAIFVNYANRIFATQKYSRGHVQRIVELIKENLYDDQSVYAKYVWLRDYLIDVLFQELIYLQTQEDVGRQREQINGWLLQFSRL